LASGVSIALAALLIAASAGAAIYPPCIVPTQPTDQDTVRVGICGFFADGCWRLLGHDCGRGEADTIRIDIYTLDGWAPGLYCLDEVWSYSVVCEYGPLPTGRYVVIATEHHDSLRWPEPDIEVREFEVVSDSPVEERSWGRIRALFRDGGP
jgi:hypothetical protein